MRRIGAPLALVLAALVLAAPGRTEVVSRAVHIQHSPAGDRLLVLSERRRVRILDGGGALLREAVLAGEATEAAFSRDGARLALALAGKGLVVLPASGGGPPAAVEASGACLDLSWDREGRLAYLLMRREGGAAEGGETYEARVWDSRTGSTATLEAVRSLPPAQPLQPRPEPSDRSPAASAPRGPDRDPPGAGIPARGRTDPPRGGPTKAPPPTASQKL